MELLSGATDGKRVAGVRFELNDLEEVKQKSQMGLDVFGIFFFGSKGQKRRVQEKGKNSANF